MAQIPEGTSFKFGEEVFRFGDDIVELMDSSAEIENPAQLWSRFQEDGYLYLRGFHDRDLATKAAQWTLQAIAERGGLAPDTDPNDGIISNDNHNFPFFRVLPVAHGKPILDVVDSDETFAFYERLFGKPVMTFDKRWLRSMAKGGHNHFHYDSVYLGRGTQNRFSMWTALTATGLEGGPLVVALGSHRHQRLIETYGATDMDRDLTEAVFTADPRELVRDFGFTLGTAAFEPGDVVIFGLYTMHSTAPNLSNRYRINIDTRYQPADEEPDERFMFRDNGRWREVGVCG
ncbi:MAG: phytanoyl-CoA dioxygenase family protein [Pseudomonadota bacterium]